jgi:negative regulator of sigma E activity
VLTNKSAKPAALKVVGPESAELPIGRLDTLRLRAEAGDGSLTVDIWLASRYGMLPVRIRIVDDEGEVLDQRAIQLRLTPVEEAARVARAAAPLGRAAAADMIELREEVDQTVDLYR